MTNPIINPQPNYSGVTIQIANPAVYACPQGAAGVSNGVNAGGTPAHPQPFHSGIEVHPSDVDGGINPAYYQPCGYATNPQDAKPAYSPQVQAYPPQYYLNNYNYQGSGNNNGTPENADVNNYSNKQDEILKELHQLQKAAGSEAENGVPDFKDSENYDTSKAVKNYEIKEEEPQDFTKSRAVIDDLDARATAYEAEKKNSKQKRVVALTDEYIKSLENYLNNPNDEIRLMASKEILTRLDEDKDRFDDAALNALLNKMLQDPSKLIRVASLSAFSAQLASGNDYTVQLLHNIQQNPNSDKEDVLQAADILLKMSAGTEIKNIPNPAVKEEIPEQNKG